MQNGLLVLQEAHAVNGSYENGYDDYGTCQVIEDVYKRQLQDKS